MDSQDILMTPEEKKRRENRTLLLLAGLLDLVRPQPLEVGHLVKTRAKKVRGT